MLNEVLRLTQGDLTNVIDEAKKKRDDFKKFLSDNKIKTDGDLNSVHKVSINIKIKGIDE